MDEPEVVLLTRQFFQEQGFKMKGQPEEGDIVLNGGEIRTDLQGFRQGNPPDLLWIECKGDNVPLKELLSDFISLLVILNEYGGQAVLACPKGSCNKMKRYNEFMERVQKNISKGTVRILDVNQI